MASFIPLRTLTIASVVFCQMAGCSDKSGQDPKSPALETPADPTPTPDNPVEAAPSAEKPPQADPGSQRSTTPGPHPTTEMDLLKAIARSVRFRDIDTMRTFTSPEATADLERIYAGDRAGFWERADVFRGDIETGLTVAHRGDDSQPTWRLLVRFGNGVEETMTFTRVNGDLKIDVF